MKFLCIDDSATLRMLLGTSLKGLGHTVLEAENGKQGLDVLAKDVPDCIILDINMPVMTGVEFLEARKANPAWLRVPVIVLTTQDEEPLRATAMKLGANGFLAKPFNKDELLAIVESTVGL